MRKIIAVLTMLFLGACAGSTGAPSVPPSAIATAQKELQAAKRVYLAGQILVAGYQALPVCGSKGAGPVCRNGAVEMNALAGLDGFKVAMDALEAGIAALAAGDKEIDVVALTTAVVKAALAVNQIAAMLKG